MSAKKGLAGLLDFKEGKMMKKTCVSTILCVILFAMVFFVIGCGPWDQPGETIAEGRRRHTRVKRLDRQTMMEDLDNAFLYNKPSKLTKQRIN